MPNDPSVMKATVVCEPNQKIWTCRLDDMPTMWAQGDTAEAALSNLKANYLGFLRSYGVTDIVLGCT